MNRIATYAKPFTAVMAVLLLGAFTAGCDIKCDGACATVVTNTPADGATGVAVDTLVTATFSEAMDPTTVIPSFTLAGPGGAVAGTVVHSTTTDTATFTPFTDLEYMTEYTATISVAAEDAMGEALEVPHVWSFTTGPDNDPPVVTVTSPTLDETGVAINRNVTATFNESMLAASVTQASAFTLTGPGAVLVTGTLAYVAAANTLQFTPDADLDIDTEYTAVVTTDVEDLLGNPMAADFEWSFTTGATSDNTAPTVTVTQPDDGATGVFVNSSIAATFSEPMDPESVTALTPDTFTITGPGATPVDGDISYATGSRTLVFDPAVDLADDTEFTATISTAAEDLAGNPMAVDHVWTFETGSMLDQTPPTVINTEPFDGTTGVCLTTGINATFDESMDPNSIDDAFTVEGPGGVLVPGVVSYSILDDIATFTPSDDLDADTTYTAMMTADAEDLSGNAMEADVEWTFETGTDACDLNRIPLNAAAPFGSFGGGAGITNQGLFTVINGDIGTTAASTLVTGFHDTNGDIYTETPLNVGTVNGSIFTDLPAPGTATTFAIASAAALAALDAFNATSPASLPGGTDPGAGQLGALTLAPGIYQAAGGSFMITGDDLTLDAQGDANAVWVFQTASTLTVGDTAPRSVILIGGAQAKNVFWHVGSSATINGAGGGTMVGTILASDGVTFSTAGNVVLTVLNGRALGLNASVTMVNTVINVPAE